MNRLDTREVFTPASCPYYPLCCDVDVTTATDETPTAIAAIMLNIVQGNVTKPVGKLAEVRLDGYLFYDIRQSW
jgi:hypothetical protein